MRLTSPTSSSHLPSLSCPSPATSYRQEPCEPHPARPVLEAWLELERAQAQAPNGDVISQEASLTGLLGPARLSWLEEPHGNAKPRRGARVGSALFFWGMLSAGSAAGLPLSLVCKQQGVKGSSRQPPVQGGDVSAGFWERFFNLLNPKFRALRNLLMQLLCWHFPTAP